MLKSNAHVLMTQKSNSIKCVLCQFVATILHYELVLNFIKLLLKMNFTEVFKFL